MISFLELRHLDTIRQIQTNWQLKLEDSHRSHNATKRDLERSRKESSDRAQRIVHLENRIEALMKSIAEGIEHSTDKTQIVVPFDSLPDDLKLKFRQPTTEELTGDTQ
jgi:hypothetical protein